MCLDGRSADNKMFRTLDHRGDLPPEMEPPAGSDVGLVVQLEHTGVGFFAPGCACFVPPVGMVRGVWPAAGGCSCLRLLEATKSQLQKGMGRGPHPGGAEALGADFLEVAGVALDLTCEGRLGSQGR